MKHYSVQPRDRIFVKSFRFLSFAKNCLRIIGKNISKNLSSKYGHKILDHAKQSATDALKTASKRAIQKTTEATDDLIENNITDRITKGHLAQWLATCARKPKAPGSGPAVSYMQR